MTTAPNTPPKCPTQADLDSKRARMLKAIETDAPSRAGLFRRVFSPTERVAPRTAIKAKCLECCWMDTIAIKECTASECPLWRFRPYQTPRRKASMEAHR